MYSPPRGWVKLQTALCDGGSGGGLCFAGDLHGREGEFDAVLVEAASRAFFRRSSSTPIFASEMRR
jgi:hypothetical protein